MSTELVLDFDKIRESEEPLPDIAVADFIPLKGDGRNDGSPRKGIVLELGNPRALKRGIELPAGPGILYVRLPTGETLAERVEVAATGSQSTGKLTLKLVQQGDGLDFPIPAPAYSAPRRPTLVESGPRFTADRSRWSKVEFEQQGWGRTVNLRSFLEPFANQVVSERQGNRGIAKLQSSAGKFRLAPKLGSRVQFDSALVGQVQAVKPTKLYGARDELRAQWKAPSTAKRRQRPEDDDRYFALAFEAADEPAPLQVACLPAKWRTLSNDVVPLTVQYAVTHRPEHRMPRVVVNVEDPRFTALLQYMQTGDVASSVSLLGDAERALYEKFTNPYAAAAGGYVLTSAGYRLWHNDWGHWLYNLATHFPALPDGHILLANLILQGPEACKAQVPGYAPDHIRELALDCVLEAVRRGPPMYRFGLRMLSSSIAILKHIVDDPVGVIQLNGAADYVRNLSMRVDPYQPFSVFDVGRNAP
jgi:hypothetical protein